MAKNLHEVNTEVLQQRLLEEIEAQQRLQEELKIALEHERDLRLENELLWVYLQRKYPERVTDAAELLKRLTAGSDLATEMQNRSEVQNVQSRSMVRRARSAVGKLPGVRRAYHGLKKLSK